MPVLETRNLSVRYDSALILEDISLFVEEKECVAVLGPNGAGKTTLLRAISRVAPVSGSITYLGEEVSRYRAHELVKKGIVHCPEHRRLFPDFTVKENLAMGAFLRQDKAEVEADLERCYSIFPRLKERLNQMARTMSGGEQQMVAIARAIMARPRLLMLDEPSIGLAQIVKEQIFQGVAEIKQLGVTILLVEQDSNMALGIADRLYVLEHGRVAAEGTPAELSRDTHIRDLYLGI
ncbi:ABC transporter ATP-binding protein [Anaerosporomusa subterranea]|uniref:ABC transporter ATP-binding protein n=1 Tax=Anaerosporomusa subterranea TaxID=1794912 RepID=A0A154BPJ5_ANASB|nr:ABC transporter ATP-binding protein [Anaerosporomusa subterranea]KYZ75815.1 ABC transporter ATP-binding protein [Anaerosporomusa subterranea]MDF2500862.1 transporter ATP-binding protein [Anaerosporomusa subterranea]